MQDNYLADGVQEPIHQILWNEITKNNFKIRFRYWLLHPVSKIIKYINVMGKINKSMWL